MTVTVADILVERLIDWNVDTIFALPGDGINGLYEALRMHQQSIRLIQLRHEEARPKAPMPVPLSYPKHSYRMSLVRQNVCSHGEKWGWFSY